ncbi:MAG: hypothetical protein ACLS20_08240 [Faecalimonas umbilicata]|uniref:hypothetical protein n=1 Tax=Faecalimonas umbilicata TaxID=1912855 RepID=UPI003994B637
MDEKKVREAIELIRMEINTLEGIENCGRVIEARKKKHIALYNIAIEALEKQLPKKVDMRTEYRDSNGALVCFEGFCPSCGCAVEYYRNKSCNRCTQMLDWSKN